MVDRESVVGMETQYKVGGQRDSIQFDPRFSVLTQPFVIGYRNSFRRLKQPERDIDHLLPSSAKVIETLEIYLFSPSGISWPVVG